MEPKFYICEFCHNEFKPTRRKVQKFCSDTCRNKNHQHKNRVEKPKPVFSAVDKFKGDKTDKSDTTKVDEMSLAGVGNSAGGVLLIQILTNFFTKLENKSATKSDIQELKDLMKQRYYQIHGMEPTYDGTIPYFDIQTSTIVYFQDPNYINTANLSG